MAFTGSGSRTGSHTSSREIQTIVEEFTAEPAQVSTAAFQGSPEPAATAVTPRSKSGLAKKLAKSLGFSSHSKASSPEGIAAKQGTQQASSQSPPDSPQQQLDKSVHFGDAAHRQQTAVQDTALPRNTGSEAVTLISANATQSSKVISPFQSISDQAGKAESVTFYSPSPSFSSVLSSRPSKAMSSNLDEEASQARRSPLGLPSGATTSGELEMRKSKSTMLEQHSADERTVSGGLAAKSRRSSLTYSVKSSGESRLYLLPGLQCSHIPTAQGGLLYSHVRKRALSDTAQWLVLCGYTSASMAVFGSIASATCSQSRSAIVRHLAHSPTQSLLSYPEDAGCGLGQVLPLFDMQATQRLTPQSWQRPTQRAPGVPGGLWEAFPLARVTPPRDCGVPTQKCRSRLVPHAVSHLTRQCGSHQTSCSKINMRYVYMRSVGWRNTAVLYTCVDDQ